MGWMLSIFACAEASIVAAVLAVVTLTALGYHKLPSGALNVQRIGIVIATSLAAYTLGVIVVCQFFAHIPSSYIISSHFKDERIAWLMITLLADLIVRLWNEFRPTPAV